MLTICGSSRQRFCDGKNRRDFLAIGALGAAGLTLADLFRLEAQGGIAQKAPNKSVIIVSLSGGTPHLDMWDMKPAAPVEIRGEFKPIQTNVPGLQICELMPRLAQRADQFAIVRNMATDGDAHQQHLAFTGFPSTAQRPPLGSIVSRLAGRDASTVPRYVSLVGELHPENTGHEEPRYAGAAHRPFNPTGPGMENLSLARGMTLERLADRNALLQAFDKLRRDIDVRGQFAGIDGFTAQALDVISSNKTRDAFDLNQEPDRVRQRYGMDTPLKNQAMYLYYWKGTKFLLARRLVEAGVRVVTVNAGYWDTHQRNFAYMGEQLPLLDQSLSALLDDLRQRGLDQDVIVLVWAEFYGRSPRINRDAGRDHWKASGSILAAGGGLRMGHAVGATDARGERPTGRPYDPQNVLATVYHALGIEPTTTIPDHNGRPVPLLDAREPIVEMF